MPLLGSHVIAEYIWTDGQTPTCKLRSKSKVINISKVTELKQIPQWSFDGSSTKQAEGSNSDCLLRPVDFIPDPLRGGNNILVMCDVLNPDGTPHQTNYRAPLEKIAKKHQKQEALFGIEQEYTFFESTRNPLGWPTHDFPEPQGKYYCGVGADEVRGRDIVEEHLKACLNADILISGINAEVMPSQWEFQIGPLGPLEVCDRLWLARWLLYRIAENYNVSATLVPKPVAGDWNGAGAHTNFSTKTMREKDGIKEIIKACGKLEKTHLKHMNVYGPDNEKRMTGQYETCLFEEFRYGVSDRGASIRIPAHVHTERKGYLEDRRPAANMNPYEVCRMLMETVCE